MSNEEIKNLMFELTAHLNQAKMLIEKLQENRANAINNRSYNAPVVLSARINDTHGKFKAVVLTSDLLQVLNVPTEKIARDSKAYPFEEIANINGVQVYELVEAEEEGENDDEAL